LPSTPPLQKLEPAGTAPQVPIVMPLAIVHTPPQQSGPWVHASPFWMQNDEAMEQVPDAQSDEQHSVLAEHALPAVLHVVLSGLQVPPEHEPPQHCASVVHA
jgi:hypothetical protein